MKKNIAELRSLSIDELKALLAEKRKEMYQLRQRNNPNKERKIHLIGAAKLVIARILTILREGELAQQRGNV